MLAPLLFVLLTAAPPAAAASGDARAAAVGAALEDWHAAAAAADEERYFARGKAWSFKATQRHVSFSKDGQVAWFDEALDTPNMGPARGSGVLVRMGSRWRIAQYNLSIPIPNALTQDVKAMVEKLKR